MKKKVTEEEVVKVIDEVADKVRREMDFDFRVLRSRMWMAENDLVETLDENQRKLYDIYRKEREAFYKIASELYERKF